ncbi:MAG: ATP-binding protein [Chloroflexota bacterium]|nr:ATP-binding protein [Chloroflexota bacterium]
MSENDLAAMLSENETLFVEHKTGLGGQGYQVAKAVCSFANTLGGWVLIGVTDSKPNEGTEDGWEPVAANKLTDRVREALKDNRVDPIPPFAATVKAYGAAQARIGIVRVYESSDAPHVMSNGQVFVRSVAEDSDRRRIYRAGGVETQSVLLSLVERGRRGVAEAKQRIEGPFPPDFAPRAVGMKSELGGLRVDGPRIILRAVPVTTSTFADWAVSPAGKAALLGSVRKLAGVPDGVHPELTTDAVGLAATQRTLGGAPTGGVTPEVGAVAVALDAAGVVGASRSFGVQTPRLAPLDWPLSQLAERVIIPLLTCVVSLLEASESFGRSVLQLDVGYIADAVQIVAEDGARRGVPSLSLGGTLTLPIAHGEIEQLATRWAQDLGRSAGLETLRA